HPIQTPAETDEFNGSSLGLQWQWMANPKSTWAFNFPANGVLRLFSEKLADSIKNLWHAPNVLLQKFPAEEFMVTTKITFNPNTKLTNEKTGLVVMGYSYASVALKSKADGIYLVYTICKNAENKNTEIETLVQKISGNSILLRVTITKGGKCNFSFSEVHSPSDITTVRTFVPVGEEFVAETGRWKGGKVGLFCTRQSQTNDAGYADADWFRVEAVK
ncbi:MAG: glycoside hydrolase, partial [Bacteroidota bacterium]